jgi:2-phospho-L-lactate guanylyltransferase
VRTLAVLPVKRYRAAKQRLTPLLPGGTREALVEAMFSDVLRSLRHSERVDTTAVVTVDPLAQARVRAERVLLLEDPTQAGQSAAAAVGIAYAVEEGYDRVLLVPGDTPLLDPAEIDTLLDRAAADRLDALFVPDRHGTGTNAVVLTPPDVLAPSFGPDSLERHARKAEDAGLAYRVLEVESLLCDVDTPDDLAELRTVLDSRRRLAPMTRGALFQLDRAWGTGASPPPPGGDVVGV